MSDSKQSIVDVEAPDAEARLLEPVVLDWLISESIVEAAATDCTLGDAPGRRPGPGADAAVEGSMEDTLRLRTNGAAIEVGRRGFDTGGNGVELHCSACELAFDPGAAYVDAVGRWFELNDDVVFACPGCGKVRRLADWDGPFAFGLGALGVSFWNWPPLRRQFVRRVGELLGHRVVVVRAHI
jgi:hypothetical protein